MLLALLLIIVVGIFAACKRRGLVDFRIDSLETLLLVVAALHGVILLPYIGVFADIPPWQYALVWTIGLVSMAVGFEVARRVARRLDRRLPRAEPVLPSVAGGPGSVLPALALIAVLALDLGYGYYLNTGTFNPTAGLQLMFSGENAANRMWSGTGQASWGAGRGAGVGEEGGIIAYMSRWFSLVPLLALAFLGRRLVWWVGIPFLLLKILSLTGSYSARTTMVIWVGVLALYFNQYVRRFRVWEVAVVLVAAFISLQVLHMARLGQLTSRDLTDSTAISSGFEQAVLDTFEPAGWCFRAYETVGSYSAGEKVDHVLSYFGALIPRVFWPTKPFYSFEPDLTMMVTLRDISASNPVRTFTVVAEGLLLGGFVGVALVCFGYAFFCSLTQRLLARYWEFTFVRYWWVLMAAIMFRTSFFTLFSAGFVLSLAPAILVGFGLRQTLHTFGARPVATADPGGTARRGEPIGRRERGEEWQGP